MFFILSKVLFFLIRPVNWIAFLLLVALFKKPGKWKRRSLRLACGLFLFFTNPLIFYQIMSWYETDHVAKASLATYDIGILLGGYSEMNKQGDSDRHTFGLTANRFTQTLELYHAGKIKKILLTGGSGDLLNQEYSEAEKMRSFLELINIPEEDIIFESRSRNTHENAKFTQEILEKSYPEATCLLISSAWHLPRARPCFTKLGMEFPVYPVDFWGEDFRWAPEATFLPDRRGLLNWDVLIKEWVGLVAYKLRGYI